MEDEVDKKEKQEVEGSLRRKEVMEEQRGNICCLRIFFPPFFFLSSRPPLLSAAPLTAICQVAHSSIHMLAGPNVIFSMLSGGGSQLVEQLAESKPRTCL